MTELVWTGDWCGWLAVHEDIAVDGLRVKLSDVPIIACRAQGDSTVYQVLPGGPEVGIPDKAAVPWLTVTLLTLHAQWPEATFDWPSEQLRTWREKLAEVQQLRAVIGGPCGHYSPSWRCRCERCSAFYTETDLRWKLAIPGPVQMFWV